MAYGENPGAVGCPASAMVALMSTIQQTTVRQRWTDAGGSKNAALGLFVEQVNAVALSYTKVIDEHL